MYVCKRLCSLRVSSGYNLLLKIVVLCESFPNTISFFDLGVSVRDTEKQLCNLDYMTNLDSAQVKEPQMSWIQ